MAETTMIAVTEDESGKLTLGKAPIPQLKPGEVLVRAAASGLNRADLVQRRGGYPPPPGASDILGLEIAGTVVETGEGTKRFKVGDRVAGLLAGGGYAAFAAVDEGSLLPVPKTMDFTHAACFPEALMTVWANVFDRVHLQAGEAFLCHGGTSGIGVMAIQMARLMGADPVFATAGSAEKCALAESLGATHGINYKTEDFVDIIKSAGGVDVTLDMVGGDYIQKNISVARMDGRIINIAYQKGMKAEINFGAVLMKRLTLAATTLRARPVEEKRRLRDQVEAQIWPHVVSGSIRPVLDRVFPAAEAEAAHAYMDQGVHSGKIVLVW